MAIAGSSHSRAAIGELQPNPLPEQPETPAVTVTRAQRLNVLTVEIERLMVLARLVEIVLLPVVSLRRAVAIAVVVLPVIVL